MLYGDLKHALFVILDQSERAFYLPHLIKTFHALCLAYNTPSPHTHTPHTPQPLLLFPPPPSPPLPTSFTSPIAVPHAVLRTQQWGAIRSVERLTSTALQFLNIYSLSPLPISAPARLRTSHSEPPPPPPSPSPLPSRHSGWLTSLLP